MLKRILTAGLVIATPALGADSASADFEHVSCTGDAKEIRLIVTGLKKGVGLVTADLYENNDETFLKRAGRVGRARFAAKAPTTRFCLEAPGPGRYAVAVYHDENANMDFDKGAFGLPAEPWGISNNPKVRFGPPKVEEALVELADGGGLVVEINLN